MSLSVTKLSEYMTHGLNIYISGEAGTGKTEVLKAASKKAGFELGYMSAPTLDAYVDLVGIPIAEESKALKRKVLEFVRKGNFEDIEVLFIDELPRGELKTLNAIFELVQFGTINGDVAMPKLKCVVAAGNPMTDDYTGQQQLDAALLDRFDIYLETDIAADLPYFIRTFKEPVGKALVGWHKIHDHKEKGYLSPRRLEKIGHTWLKMPEIGTLKAMVPPGGTFNVDLLQRSLVDAVKGSKIEADPSSPLSSRLTFMAESKIREAREEIIRELPSMSAQERAIVTEKVSWALKRGSRVDNIIQDWSVALEYFSNADKSAMMANWDATRIKEFTQKANAANLLIGSKLK